MCVCVCVCVCIIVDSNNKDTNQSARIWMDHAKGFSPVEFLCGIPAGPGVCMPTGNSVDIPPGEDNSLGLSRCVRVCVWMYVYFFCMIVWLLLCG